VVGNVTGLGENLFTLAELQARLAAIEFRQNLESARSGGVLMIGAFLLAVSSLPVLIAGVAELLVSEVGIRRGYAFLMSGMGAIVIAGVCLAIAREWLRKKPLGFPLSGEEFARNLNWLRTILRHSSRWPIRR
jgi:hypothetical protein